MLDISSSHNPLIKEIKGLSRKKNRYEGRVFIVEGIKIIEEAIKSGIGIRHILFSEDFLDSKEGSIFYEKIKYRDNIVKVKSSLFTSISDTENPQGIMAVCEFNIRDLSSINHSSKRSIMFLDGIQDPGNLGTIIRTADAFNMDGIILGEGCVDPYNLKVVRSTMGSIFRVPLYLTNNSLDSLRGLKDKGFKIYSTSLDGKVLYENDFNEKFICVIGNEANGVNSEILDISDKLIKIPMPGNAESLNAGVAASIIMYETMRTIDRYFK